MLPVDSPIRDWRCRPNPRYGAATLREYRLSFPNTALIPTITQRGLIGPLLRISQRKALRAARRWAARQRMRHAFRTLFAKLWKRFTRRRA